ncbi:MAG: hypothetical protein HYR56_21795 [Acidobacteria bacterium]|nr:hypothetical protein [Acidobacteriota bacterium]MBI3423061.1 hypothetical protein [Acidobacteriota bacterium]
MKQALAIVFASGLIGTALTLSGCAQPEAPKPAPAPAASPAAATPAPTEAPKLTAADHLTSAKDSLTKAVGELKEKNYQGAQDLLTSTKTHLTEAAATAPAPVKAGIDKVVASLAGIKDIKAPGTDKTLSNLAATVTSLAETAKKAGAMADTAKGAMTGAASAAGGMMDKAAGAAKDAAPKKH